MSAHAIGHVRQTVDPPKFVMASRSEAESKDLKKFNILLIHGILRL